MSMNFFREEIYFFEKFDNINRSHHSLLIFQISVKFKCFSVLSSLGGGVTKNEEEKSGFFCQQLK